MKGKLLSVFGILALLSGLFPGSVIGAAPAHAQEPVPPQKVYLPIVVTFGRPAQPPQASSYAAALSQALSDCANMALNQVCFGAGSVTLTGGGALTTPGQTASLENVPGIMLVSPDVRHWSVALLRLAGEAATPGLGLTILAFGNVEISNLALFTPPAGNGATAPALSFRSSPVPGQDPETGGLIVYNPTHENTLAIRLNGADLTLASSAVVEAQPGGLMSVIMATGSALVSTAAGSSAVAQASQVSVPLDGNGVASGAPTAPILTDEELLVPLVPDPAEELLVPLVPPKPERDPVKITARLLAEFESAQNRCTQGDSLQVYRVMWYARMLEQYKAYVPNDRYLLIDWEVMNCATFEFEFNSTMEGSSTMASGSLHVKGQGLTVRFGSDGRLVEPGELPLTHASYNFSINPGVPCPYQITLADGLLYLYEGYMRINFNRLDISTKVYPVHISENMTVNCPYGSFSGPSHAFWRNMFRDMHQSETVDGGLAYLFKPEHWKYLGNEILAEAIVERQVPFWDGAFAGDTWMILLHKPGH